MTRTYVELHAAGALRPETPAVPLRGIEAQMRFLWFVKHTMKLECPTRGHSFSPLDALGGDVAALDRGYDPTQIFECPECHARCVHELPLVGDPRWGLAAGACA